jgi:hypothetical protein
VKDLEYPQAYEAMFRFMYGLEHDKNMPSSGNMGFYFAVLCVARTYGCLRLEDLASEKFVDSIIHDWDQDEFLKILGKDQYHDNLDFWTVLIGICHHYIDQLSKDPKFQAILKKHTALAVALVHRLGKYQKKFFCDECEETWSFDSSLFSSPSYCPNCGGTAETYHNS